ncbi:MAG TPA: LamG-like jellyroll fold domain-containing protein [Candidatus Acidoferrum sp.]|nr:LamG-like jellyroll fold domain-containing protein [Candidatus Acidoferrum sp.]
MKTTSKLSSLAVALCAAFITQSSQAQPTIVQNPPSMGLYAGRTASLTVQATGTAPLSYQWMAGATGSGIYTNLANGGSISGATSTNLIITGVTADNAGDYVVVVTDGTSSSVTSDPPATLTVVPMPSDTYGVTVMADNPVAFWRMNETGGKTAYDYASGFNGTYGTATLNQPGLSTNDDNVSVYFNGVYGSDIVIPFNVALNPSVMTVEIWAKPNPSALPTSSHKCIIGGMPDYPTASQFQNGYSLQLLGTSPSSSDNYYFELGSTNPVNGVTINAGSVVLGWSHLVGTYDGSNMVLYVNGKVVSSAILTNFIPNIYTNPVAGYPWVGLAIGSIYDSTGVGAEFNGNICEAAVYNTALSSNQVVNHYARGLFGGELPPVILQQPQSLTLYVGETATFSPEVAAYFPTYTWMAAPHGSTAFTNLANGGNISGTTTTSLAISNISAANVADYVLVVTNPMGSVTSSVVTLNVQPLPTDVYGLDVLADKPAAYWRLNEASGDTAYDYVGGHNGAYQGGVTLNQPGISAFDMTGAALFDGSSGYVQVPYASALNTPTFTVECWVDQTGGSGNQQAPFANQNNGAGYDLFSYPAGPDQWAFQVSPGYDAFGTGGVALNHWTHLAGTFDGNNQILYVNGVPVATNQIGGFTANSAAPLNIGAGNNDQASPAFYWTGLINEVAVYSAVLTPNQILKHYDLSTTGTVPAPVITHQPQSLSLYSNLTASFSVQAQSLVTVSYQWMAGPTGSHVYTNLVNAGNISGVATSNLVITALSAANAADYVAVVSNSSGSVTSSVATLTMIPAPTDTYGALVVAGGPVAYWRMNETSGTVMHDYMGGHNGTYQGGVTLNQAGISSYDTNGAVRFDGSSGYAQVPNSPALNTPAFSVECWLNPSQAGSPMSAIGNQDSVNGTDGYDLSVTAGSPDDVTFTVGATNLSIGYTPLDAYAGQAGQWTHVVATFQNSNTVLYINGQLAATNTPSSYPTWLTPNSAWPLYIGAGNNDQATPANYWSGLINEVAVYKTVLTPVQVQQHYSVAALGGYSPPTISQSTTNLQRYATMSATFAAQVTSFLPTVTYQWMAGAQGSGVYTNLLNAGNISGATTTNMVITNLALANAADYVLVAQNAAGSVTSLVTTLSVQALPSDAYGAAVVANNPVAFWRLNETVGSSGSKAYDYAGGYNGTYQSGVTVNQSGPGGYANTKSDYFSGTSANNIIVPWAAALNPSLLTVECWVALPSTLPTGSQNRKIVIGSMPNTNTASGNSTGYYLNLEINTSASADKWSYTVGSGQSWSTASYNAYSSGNLQPLQWTHLVGTYDGTTETLYTNGVKASSHAVPYYPNIYPNAGPNVTAQNQAAWPYVPLGIGSLMNSGGPGAGFNGNISDAAVYNYALSAYQVLNQYTAAKTGAGVGVPVFTLQPQSVSTNSGSTVSLVGQATFAQPLTYQWMVQTNGVYINLVNGGSISGATTTNLVIASVTSANATKYELVASYPGISATSSEATLTVTGSPPPIDLTSTFAVGKLTLSWTNSAYALQQATNVVGPWINTTNLSGYQVNPTNPAMFFRLVAP